MVTALTCYAGGQGLIPITDNSFYSNIFAYKVVGSWHIEIVVLHVQSTLQETWKKVSYFRNDRLNVVSNSLGNASFVWSNIPLTIDKKLNSLDSDD